MVAQDGTVINRRKQEAPIQHVPDSLAKAREVISTRIEGVVLVDQKVKGDRRKKKRQQEEANKWPRLARPIVL